MQLHPRFPRYEQFDPQVPAWCVTPEGGGYIHRFFDTSPFSPSGQYLAVFRLPFEDRLPAPGDKGQVVLIDLHAGEQRVVAETAGWEPQLGANLNWGADDHSLFFNDIDTQTWRPHGVRLDPLRGTSRRLERCVYHVSPDGKLASCCAAQTMRRTQVGYGVTLPDEHTPRHVGLAEDDGLWLTDTDTGQARLLISIADAARQAAPWLTERDPASFECYCFHSKFNAQGDRLIFTLRHFPADQPVRFNALHHRLVDFEVMTIKPDGSDLHNAVPEPYWKHGGHHINFFPDGRRLSMNLRHDAGGDMLLTQVNHDGSDLRPITRAMPGSGHPTVHPDGRHILTDTYVNEVHDFGDGSVPIRWIDLETPGDRQILRIASRVEPMNHGALRVDPHPAWDRTMRWFAFNGVANNTRRVFVADATALLE